MAEFLGLDLDTFTHRYAYREGGRYSLNEKPGKSGLDCIFLEEHEGKRICSVYPVRPVQCRTWPFWSDNLKSPAAWETSSQKCPGMNNGKHYSYVQIEIRRAERQ
jgi:hypothetical protein